MHLRSNGLGLDDIIIISGHHVLSKGLVLNDGLGPSWDICLTRGTFSHSGGPCSLGCSHGQSEAITHKDTVALLEMYVCVVTIYLNFSKELMLGHLPLISDGSYPVRGPCSSKGLCPVMRSTPSEHPVLTNGHVLNWYLHSLRGLCLTMSMYSVRGLCSVIDLFSMRGSCSA